MDLNEIKEIIEIDEGRFIIVENGKPMMVILSFEDYKSKIKLNKKEKDNQNSINLAEKPFVRPHSPQEQKPTPKELKEEGLKIEDLPL